MSSQPDSDSITPEALAIQIIQENPELAKKYTAGDMAALGALQEKAVKLGAGKVNARELEEKLMQKLRDSY